MHFELTDTTGGEKFERFALGRGDLVLADRAYCGVPGLRWVTGQGAYALVRMRLSQDNFYLPGSAQSFDFLQAAEALAAGAMLE